MIDIYLKNKKDKNLQEQKSLMFFLNPVVHIEDNHGDKVYHDQYTSVDLKENVQHHLLNVREFLDQE